MGIARFDQYFELNVRALLSTNENGKITLEGGIKGRGMKEEATFDFWGLGFERRRVFSPFFELELVDPDLRFLFFRSFGFKRL